MGSEHCSRILKGTPVSSVLVYALDLYLSTFTTKSQQIANKATRAIKYLRVG